MRRIHEGVAKALLLVAALVTVHAQADIIAAEFTLPQTPFGCTVVTCVDGIDGFEFTTAQNISVTMLGWYDNGADGLLHSHPVGIFDTITQAALASVTVTSSSVLDAASGFRFEALGLPLALLAGHSYTVAGFGAGPIFDDYVHNPIGGVTYGPDINFVQYRAAPSGGLVFPTLTPGGDPFFGPNFTYVPEPATIALLGLGLAGLGFSRRKQ